MNRKTTSNFYQIINLYAFRRKLQFNKIIRVLVLMKG
jgi:hypothetical protein